MQLLSACLCEHLRTCINMSSGQLASLCGQIIKCQNCGTIAEIKECSWIKSILDKRRSGEPAAVGSAQSQGPFPKGLSG